MPENMFSSRDNGRDGEAVQNKKHLQELTADELTDALSDIWDSMDENNYDPAQLDEYLSELEKRDPVPPGFDVDTSLAAFHEKHSRLLEQVPPVQPFTASKPVQRRRWRSSLVAVAAAAAMLLGGAVTAQAFGIDLFGAIARWTKDSFSFSLPSPGSSTELAVSVPTDDGGFATLQDALNNYNIAETIAPQWYPEGSRVVSVSVFPRGTGVTIQADYEAEELFISVSVRQYATAKDAEIGIGSFEKDPGPVIQFECGDVVHYIMTNNSSNVATWVNGSLVCSISGNMTVDDLKQMIKSIYEG